MRIRALFVVATVLALAASLSVGGPAFARPDSTGTTWGPIVTVADQSFGNLSTVTTDNGLVVAVWSGQHFSNLFIATRPTGGDWSAPTKIVTSAAGVTLSKDGDGAWVLWQGFEDVSVVRVAGDGTVGTPEVVGGSSDPFISDARIAAGANGAVAAVWQTDGDSPIQLSYHSRGGGWTPAKPVPADGDVAGLVVGSAGTAQVVVQRNNPDFRHQEVSYLRRSPAGDWSTPFVVASQAYLTTVVGNRHGDVAVGWEVVNADSTFSLKARYKAAGSGFGDTHELGATVPENTHVALAIAGDGSLASAYRTTTTGSQQIQMTPADSTGFWLAPQDLSLTGSTYDVTMNAAGDAVVTSIQSKGVQVSRCPAGGTCGPAETNRATRFRFPSTTLGPHGTITLVWGRGCKTEECSPTSLVAQLGR